jgi:peptide subunit release factor RF-3
VQNLAQDANGHLVYIAPTYVNLQLTQERFQKFNSIRLKMV